MKLIDNWNAAWKYSSVRFSAILIAIVPFWYSLSLEEQQLILSLVPEEVRPLLVSVCGLIAIILRVTDFKPNAKSDE